MAGLLERLRTLLGEPDVEASDSVAALAVAYQKRLASLHEVRTELEAVRARRRRLAIAAECTDSVFRPIAERQDLVMTAQEARLRELSDALRGRLEEFRSERDLIDRIPDQAEADRQARDALVRWRADAGELLRSACEGYPEPSGFVADEPSTDGYQQPPGLGGVPL